NTILQNKRALDEVLLKELRGIIRKYVDSRRTEIEEEQEKAEIGKKDLIEEKEAYISLSYKGQIKRNEKLENMRAGKKDYLIRLVSGITYDNLLFFTDGGMVYSLPVHNIPEHHGLSTGDDLSEYLQMDLDEELVGLLCLNEEVKNKKIIIATRNGIVKMTEGVEYETTYNKIKAINLNEGDRVIDVGVVEGNEEIMLGSWKGKTIRFAGNSVSTTGRNTIGSRGMKLDENDRVINMNILREQEYVVSLTPEGKANRIRLEAFRSQNRNGKGLKTVQASCYRMACILTVVEKDKLLLATKDGNFHTLDVIDIAETQRPGYLYEAVELLDEDETIKDIFILPGK
ncbi:MAG: DNA gyrase C-terminal beta-propeller domain-containing protein, partial [Halanaerobiales bacterium]